MPTVIAICILRYKDVFFEQAFCNNDIKFMSYKKKLYSSYEIVKYFHAK